MSIKLNAAQTISEFERRGIELAPNEASITGYTLKVGPSGAAIPDWLFVNLEQNSSEIATRVGVDEGDHTEAAPAEPDMATMEEEI